MPSVLLRVSPFATGLLLFAFITVCATAQAKSKSDTRLYTVRAEAAYHLAVKKGYRFYAENLDRGQRDFDGNMIAGVECAAPTKKESCAGFSEMVNGTWMGISIACKDTSTSPSRPVRCSNRFHLFAGKQLSTGWQLERVEVQNGRVSRQTNPSDPHIIVDITNPKGSSRAAAVLRSITLRGPINKRWEEAFNAKYSKLRAQ